MRVCLALRGRWHPTTMASADSPEPCGCPGRLPNLTAPRVVDPGREALCRPCVGVWGLVSGLPGPVASWTRSSTGSWASRGKARDLPSNPPQPRVSPWTTLGFAVSRPLTQLHAPSCGSCASGPSFASGFLPTNTSRCRSCRRLGVPVIQGLQRTFTSKSLPGSLSLPGCQMMPWHRQGAIRAPCPAHGTGPPPADQGGGSHQRYLLFAAHGGTRWLGDEEGCKGGLLQPAPGSKPP
jgi:hypothetical protein